jgi:hypothetical protein
MIDITKLKQDIKTFFLANLAYPHIQVSPSQYLELLEEAQKERRLIHEELEAGGGRTVHGAEISGWGYFVINKALKHGETVLK